MADAAANYQTFIAYASTLVSPDQLEKLKRLRLTPSLPPDSSDEATLVRDRDYVIVLGSLLEKYIQRRYREELSKVVLDRGLARVLHEVANTSVYMELQARGLLAYLQRLDDDPGSAEDIRKAGELIAAMALEARYECQNLLASIDLDTAGASQATRRIFFDPLDMLRDLLPTFEFLCRADDKKIKFSGPDDESLSEVTFPEIRGYPDLLRRALFNVLSNALKYSYKTTLRADRYISVRADPWYTIEPRRMAISVSNYGIGFSTTSEKTKATRFGFRGSQAMSERPVGSGIGLSEVDRILRRHNGYIEIRSEPIGSTPAHTVVWLVFNHR